MRRHLLTVALLSCALGAAGAVYAMWRHAHEPVEYASRPPVWKASGLSWQKVAIEAAATSERATPEKARITNVQIVDFDNDGVNDVLVCDPQRNAVMWYESTAAGWREHLLAENLLVPAHATLVDLDADGDRDVVVAELGDIWPSDELVGRLVLLENQGAQGGYRRHVLLDAVRRVADAQAGDFDGDGDLDLAVAVFGYSRGEVLWLENLSAGKFCEHRLWSRAGAIHVPVADFDGDGDLDIATVISQDDEEVLGFENDGHGEFRPRTLFSSLNYDLGSAGLVLTDLDQDGDADLLLPVGDNLEENYTWPQPYHGCFWLENLGDWRFAARRIATYGSTYAAAAGDLDADGDLDVVLASFMNDWNDRELPSIVWLQNDGAQNFQLRPLDTAPTHLVTVACGDLNGDGRDDVVAGGLHLRPPFDRLGRVSAWMSQSASRAAHLRAAEGGSRRGEMSREASAE
ncbi:MAG TPA: VCBS repeat-containing protein [Pirellulales bacterium]